LKFDIDKFFEFTINSAEITPVATIKNKSLGRLYGSKSGGITIRVVIHAA
jgi:hypothetical protein